MINNCSFCSSTEVKMSRSYKDMWYCKSCSKGDLLGKAFSSGTYKFDISLASTYLGRIYPEHKTLFITQTTQVNHYIQVHHGTLIFNRGVDPISHEYGDVMDAKSGIFIYSTASPEILIGEDFDSLAFDHIIVIGVLNKEKINHTIKSFEDHRIKHGYKKVVKLYVFE